MSVRALFPSSLPLVTFGLSVLRNDAKAPYSRARSARLGGISTAFAHQLIFRNQVIRAFPSALPSMRLWAFEYIAPNHPLQSPGNRCSEVIFSASSVLCVAALLSQWDCLPGCQVYLASFAGADASGGQPAVRRSGSHHQVTSNQTVLLLR